MTTASRWLSPVALAVGLSLASTSPPVAAQSTLQHVIVDTLVRGGAPHSHAGYGYGNGYYSTSPQYGYGKSGHHDVDHVSSGGYYGNGYGNGAVGYGYQGPPYGNAYGYYGNNRPQHVSRRHARHDRHDCQVHGQCDH